MESTPVKVIWHSKINQIVTGLSNGTISVLYSAETSAHGAKLLLSKGAPKRPTVEDMSDALAAPTILTPHALPMFKDGDGIVRGTKRRREKDRQDPRKSRRPELPVTGPGKGGRVGASATQHVVQNLVRDTTRDEDVSDLVVCAVRFFWLVISHLISRDAPRWLTVDIFVHYSHGKRSSSMRNWQIPIHNGLEVSILYLPLRRIPFRVLSLRSANSGRLPRRRSKNCIVMFVLICRLTWRLFPVFFFFSSVAAKPAQACVCECLGGGGGRSIGRWGLDTRLHTVAT